MVIDARVKLQNTQQVQGWRRGLTYCRHEDALEATLHEAGEQSRLADIGVSNDEDLVDLLAVRLWLQTVLEDVHFGVSRRVSHYARRW